MGTGVPELQPVRYTQTTPERTPPKILNIERFIRPLYCSNQRDELLDKIGQVSEDLPDFISVKYTYLVTAVNAFTWPWP